MTFEEIVKDLIEQTSKLDMSSYALYKRIDSNAHTAIRILYQPEKTSVKNLIRLERAGLIKMKEPLKTKTRCKFFNESVEDYTKRINKTKGKE